MKTLYFDCFAGASGNMILGGLVALGVDRETLVNEIRKLNIPDFGLEIETVDRSGISGIHVNVKVPHEHVHRHLHHIEKIIGDSSLSDSVKTRAIAIFTRLAEAEAKIHGMDIKKVHFHEVGAMDAIVDVVGACIGFEMLGIEKFACSKIHVGSGFAEMAHGKFPIPPPAVAELLKGTPIYSTEIEGELITPTGAAIISTVCDSYGTIPEMQVEASGYGAGTREYKSFPNALRLMVGETADGGKVSDVEHLVLIETNIDDMSPQVLGYVMERAFETGALDCWFTSIQMKKNRPATMVSVLCKPAEKDALARLLYTETSTLGVRVSAVTRECLPRINKGIETDYGTVDVKIARMNGTVVNVKPEYDQVRDIAVRSGKPLREVEAEIEANIRTTVN